MRAEVPDPAGDGGYPMITSALIKLGLSQDGKALETLGEAISGTLAAMYSPISVAVASGDLRLRRSSGKVTRV